MKFSQAAAERAIRDADERARDDMTDHNPLAFLDEPETEAPAPGAAPTAEASAEAPPTAPPAAAAAPEAAKAPDQSRDEQGRFKGPQDAPADSSAVNAKPAAAAAAPEAQPQPGHVPIAALMDERDKRKALETELAKLKTQPAPQPKAPPSVLDDEQGFTAHLAQQQQMAALQTRMDIYEELARGEHGDEKVDKAWDAACERSKANPAFRQEVLSAKNPIKFAIDWHEREAALASLKPDELANFRKWQAEQAPAPAAGAQPLASPQAAAPAASPQQPFTPPTDLVSAPGASAAGGITAVPSGPGRAFGALFGD